MFFYFVYFYLVLIQFINKFYLYFVKLDLFRFYYIINFFNSISECWMCFYILCSFILILMVVWQWLLSLLILEKFYRFFQTGKILVHNKLKKFCHEMHFLRLLHTVLSNKARRNVSQVLVIRFISFFLLRSFRFLSKNF